MDVELRNASAVFRVLSDDCWQVISTRFEDSLVEAEKEIVPVQNKAGVPGICFIRRGQAQLDTGYAIRHLQSGDVFGEASLLGLPELCGGQGRLHAVSDCVVQVLRMSEFMEVLAHFPEDMQAIVRFSHSIKSDANKIVRLLKNSEVFHECGLDFLNVVSQHLTWSLFSPGEMLFERGEECLADESPMFLTVSGTVDMEAAEDAILRSVEVGEVLGASGPIGPVEFRATAARACWTGGLVAAVRIPGTALEFAYREYPEERGKLERAVCAMEASEQEAIEERLNWLTEAALPALARTPLLAGCPDEFLRALAAPLTEASYAGGEEIVRTGMPAASMLVVLEGAVELESQAGAKLQRLTKDGVLGEAELLGLFDMRLYTARATATCRMLVVTAEALQRALCIPGADTMKEGLKRLVESRRKQMEKGMPLCQLPIGANAEDATVRAAAIHAERLYFDPEQPWEPLPDTDALGPHLGVLARGRARVVLAANDKEVMTLPPGSLLIEGLLAEFGAQVRLLSPDCLVYRFRRFELEAAARLPVKQEPGKVRSMAQEAADWFYQLRLQERDLRQKLQERLNSAKGLIAIRQHHPCDPCIHDWSTRRQNSMKRAQQLRRRKAEDVGGKAPLLQLPLLPSPSMGTTLHRSWTVGSPRQTPKLKTEQRKPLPTLPRSLAAYPVMRLPRVQSEPLLRQTRVRSRASSRSERSVR